jgi:hypothetical protein
MTIRKNSDLTYADVTPKSVYLNRRQILRGMGIAGAMAIGGKLVSNLVFPETTLYAGTSSVRTKVIPQNTPRTSALLLGPFRLKAKSRSPSNSPWTIF